MILWLAYYYTVIIFNSFFKLSTSYRLAATKLFV